MALHLALLLLGGALVSFAVATALTIVGESRRAADTEVGFVFTKPIAPELRDRWNRDRLAGSESAPPDFSFGWSGPGWCRAMIYDPDFMMDERRRELVWDGSAWVPAHISWTGGPDNHFILMHVRAGWPWTCVEGVRAAYSSPDPTLRRESNRALARIPVAGADEILVPLRPTIGLVADAAVWGVVTYGIALGAIRARRRWRRRRERCPRCAYLVRDLAQCPECGERVRTVAVTSCSTR